MSPIPHRLAVAIACALAANAVALPSQAQQATAQQATPTSTSTAASPTQATELGKITVTAQSRSQEMQQVPIAMDIVTKQQIESVAATGLAHMNTFLPGVVVDNTDPTQPTFRIRGIETDDFGIGTESAVGVYVDGVYQIRNGGALMAFNDVARVEVLKGPQGTLFGRNTAAGAISIITNEPTDKLQGDARVRIGSYGTRYADALLNLPINPDMALRLSVLDNQSDGYLRAADTGQHFGKDDESGARAVYRWNITPDTRLLLTWDHDRLHQPSRMDVGLVPLSSTDLYQRPPFPAQPATWYNPVNAPLYDSAGAEGREWRRYNALTMSIDHDFRWGSLTSTTSFTDSSIQHIESGTGTNHITSFLNTGVLSAGRTWYQDFKFNGSNDLIDWVAGASFYQEHSDQTNLAQTNTNTYDTLAINSGIGKQYTPDGTLFGYFDSLLAGFGLPYRLLGAPWTETITNTLHSRSWAGYGDVIWHLTDKLDLTTGARFTHDEKQFTWFTPTRYAPQLDATIAELNAAGLLDLAPALTGGKLTKQGLLNILTANQIFASAVNQLVERQNHWNDFSPRMVLDYKFTPDVMGYASLAKGYKAGGYDGTQPGAAFSPEKVWNLETGIKTVFPKQHVLLNASVYTYRYDNRQTLTVIPTTEGLGVPQYAVSNTNQKATGVDLLAQWVPNDSFQLTFNGSYIDSIYGKAELPAGLNAEGQPTYINVTGQPVDEPKFSWSLAGNYTWRDVFGGTLAFDATFGFRGPLRCNAGSIYQGQCSLPTHFDLNAARKRTDLRLDWTARGGRWGIGAYVNNLFDHRYITSLGTVTESVLGTPYAYVTPPRMWGVEARVKF